MNEDEDDLCRAVEACDVKEHSAFYKAAWENALKLDVAELDLLKNRTAKRLWSIKKKALDILPKAKELDAERKKWTEANKPHWSNQTDYYLWRKWNTARYLKQRNAALKFIEEAGLNIDAEAGVNVESKEEAGANVKQEQKEEPKPKPKPNEAVGAKVKEKPKEDDEEA